MAEPDEQLIPTAIDELARKTPQRTWGCMPIHASVEYRDISYAELANAINRAAWWASSNIDPSVTDSSSSGQESKTVVSYVGPADLRYYILLVALVKAGFVPLFLSHTNSHAGNDALLKATNCGSILYGFESVETLPIDASMMRSYRAPTMDYFWHSSPVRSYEFEKAFEEIASEPLMIVQTSGSTGTPKPVTYTHASFATMTSQRHIPGFDGHHTEHQYRRKSQKTLLGFPPFHAAGILIGLCDSIFYGTTLVFAQPDRPLDAHGFCDVVDRTGVKGAVLLPTQLEELAKSSEALERVKKFVYIAWAGGPISQTAGDTLARYTTLINSYSSTEALSLTCLVKPAPEDWPYNFFHPHYNGCEFRPVPHQPDLYELFIRRDLRISQHVFHIFPQMDEWPMHDLFTPHPTKPHYWRFAGRADDMIVFATGRNHNPRGAESTIKRAPNIKDAVLFGSGRHRPGLLIEPVHTIASQEAIEALIDTLWSYVEESNRLAPSIAQICRELVVIAKPEKALPKTAKRKIQRKAALALYEAEIEEAYERLPPELRNVEDYRLRE